MTRFCIVGYVCGIRWGIRRILWNCVSVILDLYTFCISLGNVINLAPCKVNHCTESSRYVIGSNPSRTINRHSLVFRGRYWMCVYRVHCSLSCNPLSIADWPHSLFPRPYPMATSFYSRQVHSLQSRGMDHRPWSPQWPPEVHLRLNLNVNLISIP